MRFLAPGIIRIILWYLAARWTCLGEIEEPHEPDVGRLQLWRPSRPYWEIPCRRYGSGLRLLAPADFYYGFGGPIATSAEVSPRCVEMVDAATTSPVMRLAAGKELQPLGANPDRPA